RDGGKTEPAFSPIRPLEELGRGPATQASRHHAQLEPYVAIGDDRWTADKVNLVSGVERAKDRARESWILADVDIIKCADEAVVAMLGDDRLPGRQASDEQGGAYGEFEECATTQHEKDLLVHMSNVSYFP